MSMNCLYQLIVVFIFYSKSNRQLNNHLKKKVGFEEKKKKNLTQYLKFN